MPFLYWLKIPKTAADRCVKLFQSESHRQPSSLVSPHPPLSRGLPVCSDNNVSGGRLCLNSALLAAPPHPHSSVSVKSEGSWRWNPNSFRNLQENPTDFLPEVFVSPDDLCPLGTPPRSCGKGGVRIWIQAVRDEKISERTKWGKSVNFFFCGMLMSSSVSVTLKKPKTHFSLWLFFFFPHLLLFQHPPPYLKMKVNIKHHINSCQINHDFLWVMLHRATCFIRNQRKDSAKSGWANVKSLRWAL